MKFLKTALKLLYRVFMFFFWVTVLVVYKVLFTIKDTIRYGIRIFRADILKDERAAQLLRWEAEGRYRVKHGKKR